MSLLLKTYSVLLYLYPAPFRRRYAVQLLDAARLAQAERPDHARLAFDLALDTLRAAAREHLRASAPMPTGYLSTFAALFTVLLLVLSVGYQQALRFDADRAPQALVTQVADVGPTAAALAQPDKDLASPAWLDSTTPFTAFYDAEGRAIASDARLHGAPPQPPSGLFDILRARGAHKVTWQPGPGIRIALVGRRLPGGAFVFSGQSLVRSEATEARFRSFLLWMWTMLVLACLGIHEAARRRQSARVP